MGSSTSTTLSTTTLSVGGGEDVQGSSSTTSSPFFNTHSILNTKRNSNTNLNNHQQNQRIRIVERQSSYKSKSPDSGEEDIEKEGPVEGSSNLVDQQPALIEANNNNKKLTLDEKTKGNNTSDSLEDEIKPLYSATSFNKRERITRNKSNSSSLRDSLSSSTSSSSSTLSSSNTSTTISSSTYPISGTKSFKMARMNSLRGNIQTMQPNGAYQAWNTDSICWEEYKRRSIAQQKRRNANESLPMSQSNTTNLQEQHIRHSPQRTTLKTPLTFKKEPIVPITNRVGMEVESSPLSNFLKNLSAAPSVVTQSMNNR